MDLDLKGKVAVVTGGGAGIGKATALMFASEGVKVVVADMDEGRGKGCVEEIGAQGGEGLFVRTDVSDRESVHNMVSSALSRFGQIDILVNNVGWDRPNSFMKTPVEDWDPIIKLNYVGMMNCSRAVLEHMIPRKAGCILSTGSDAGRVGEPSEPVYSGAKAAIITFSKALAKTVARDKIRVNVICPSLTMVERRTDAEAQLYAEGDAQKIKEYEDWKNNIVKMYPMRKLGTPQDIAHMMVFLASDKAAGHVTGQTISVNGGYAMP